MSQNENRSWEEQVAAERATQAGAPAECPPIVATAVPPIVVPAIRDKRSEAKSIAFWIVVGALGFPILLCGGFGLLGQLASHATRRPDVAVEKVRTAPPEVQEQRLVVINLMIGQKLIQKVEGGRMWVMPAFHLATFDTKQEAAFLCHAYAYEVPRDPTREERIRCSGMTIVDAMTGKSIGYFSLTRGLEMD